MLSLFVELESWVDRVRSTEGSELLHSFTYGRDDVSNRSAHVDFGSLQGGATVSVWESGQVEAEFMIFDSMDRPIMISATIHSGEELRAILDRVFAALLAAESW